MSDFLRNMATLSAERAAAVPAEFASADFDKPLVPLTLSGFDVIAEIKNCSPAEGTLNNDASDLVTRAAAYTAGGAAAISVLTEPSRFAGQLEHLTAVAAAVPATPVMRKDFLVDAVQIPEARKAGASGVLLITTMLSDSTLREMLDRAWELGLFVLLEAFDEGDLRRTSALLKNPEEQDKAAAGQLLIGVNTRNLRTLAVDADRLQKLAPLLPQATGVAESGLKVADDAARVAGWGYRMALVGTALMKSGDPAALIQAMRTAGATACS